jgi:hypothetical protein
MSAATDYNARPVIPFAISVREAIALDTLACALSNDVLTDAREKRGDVRDIERSLAKLEPLLARLRKLNRHDLAERV